MRRRRRRERPGLGTGWGQQVKSEMGYTSFVRASSSPYGGPAVIYYNDQEGVEAMTSWRYSGKGMQTAANGVVEWGVKGTFGTLKNYQSGGRRYVVGRAGQRYSLVVKNLAKSRLEVVLSVDGLDVLDGKAASYRKRGYIVSPGQTLEVKGWRTSQDAVAAFKFSSVSGSYSNLKGSGTRNVGVIGMAVFAEKGVDPFTWMPDGGADGAMRRVRSRNRRCGRDARRLPPGRAAECALCARRGRVQVPGGLLEILQGTGVWVVTASLLVAGVAGVFLPFLPGHLLIFIAAAGHWWMLGDRAGVEWWTLVVLGLLLILSQVVEYLSGAIGTRWFGGSRWGAAGAVVGGLAGILFMPWGLVLGPLAGAFAARVAGREEGGQARDRVPGVGIGGRHPGRPGDEARDRAGDGGVFPRRRVLDRVSPARRSTPRPANLDRDDCTRDRGLEGWCWGAAKPPRGGFQAGVGGGLGGPGIRGISKILAWLRSGLPVAGSIGAVDGSRASWPVRNPFTSITL